MSRLFAGDRSPLLIIGMVAILFGAGTVVLDALSWYDVQDSLSLYGQPTILPMVTRFFVAMGIATAVVVIGAYFVYRALRIVHPGSEPASVGTIVSQALASRRDVRIGIIFSVVYAAVFLVASSTIVYQPGIDFSSVYGVSATSWNAIACCGTLGTVPALIVYLSPQAHLALQIIPINALFVFVVPMLVGFNVSIASFAFRSRPTKGGGMWVSSIGALVGLFTGCPTCAGLFLASAVGGVGATTLAVALAPYQLLFVFVSIPLLLLSPIAVAASVRKSYAEACRLPQRVVVGPP